MRILIIGGTGLISTAISRQLLERGDVELWHYNRGKSPPKLPLPGEVRVIQGDRTDHPAFEARLRAEPPFDCVIDMIGFLPAEAESLVRAVRGRARQVIFCSTVDVYDKPASRYPITEEEGRSGLNDYGRNKVRSEDVLLEAERRGDLPLTIIRPAHTYGEGGGIIHSLLGNRTYLDRVKKGKPIVVHGDGTSLWTSCHVDDVARAFVGAVGNPRAIGRAYHATGEEWMTWNRYHEIIAELVGVPTPPRVYIPSEVLAEVAPSRGVWCIQNFFLHNIFDNRRAREELGFRYTVSFRDGMRRAIRWFEERGMIEDSDQDAFYDALVTEWGTLRAGLAAALKGKEKA
jgi:nucleoside-diphosphate-sugar epimerase